jgi:hypothetical protein
LGEAVSVSARKDLKNREGEKIPNCAKIFVPFLTVKVVIGAYRRCVEEKVETRNRKMAESINGAVKLMEGIADDH